ncbi:unnamed protein product [Leptidea sinapis]|uniref:Kazal-like domain-containing protein n=1 Tax=Leptidea sinapis TaxID=189913 RepID=A0A5E4QT19_9NEOP|nr:unnamed protein product [Leptidea sinapis]
MTTFLSVEVMDRHMTTNAYVSVAVQGLLTKANANKIMKQIKEIVTFILSIVAWASAKSKLLCDLECAHDNVPVCATNGQTYGNRCLCDCRGATFAHKGVCKADAEPNVDDSTTQAP